MGNATRIQEMKKHYRGIFSLSVLFIILSFALMASFLTIAGCSDDDDDDDPAPTATFTMTPTITMTPTMTPTMGPTNTPTPVPGWREEQELVVPSTYNHHEVKIDLAANENGELLLAYIKDFHKIEYMTRDAAGNWSSIGTVPGSDGRIEHQRFYIQASIDNNMDLHFTWTGPGSGGAPWHYCYYNMYINATQSWKYADGIDVTWGNNYTLAPDIATTPGDTRRYVASQSGWCLAFNWDFGEGLQTAMSYPLCNDGGEPKRPRLAITPDGIVHMMFYDYFGPSGNASPQIGYGMFNPETQGWSAWESPALVPYGSYPGGPAIAAGPDGSVHMIWLNWHDGPDYDELCYAHKDANGEWHQWQTIWLENGIIREPFEADFPCIAVNEDGAVMVLAKAQNSWEEVVYYFVKRPGESFTPATKIPVASEKQWCPGLAASGQVFSITWNDSRGKMYSMDYVP